jgi:SPP1 gp7 family putative phage head morphogenesis protein
MPSVKANMWAGDRYVQGHIYALENWAIKQLYEEYRRAYYSMSATLAQANDQYRFGSNEKWSASDPTFRQRTEYLMGQISMEMGRLTSNTAEITLDAAMQAFYSSYAGKNWVASMAAGDRLKMPILPRELVQAQILAPYEGGTFIDRFYANRGGFEDGLRRSLVQSQILGEGIDKASKRIAEELGINLSARGAVPGRRAMSNAARVEMIARTEIIRASNNAAQVVMENNRDVLDGWYLGLAYDDRTCDICVRANANDRVYKIGSGPQPPLHPNCRCTPVPVVSDSDIRDKIVGRPPTFNEWASSNGTLAQYGRWLTTYTKRSESPPKKQ